MISSLVGTPSSLRPRSDFLSAAFCKGNRVTLQPARIQTAQDFGNLFGLAGGLTATLFSC